MYSIFIQNSRSTTTIHEHTHTYTHKHRKTHKHTPKHTHTHTHMHIQTQIVKSRQRNNKHPLTFVLSPPEEKSPRGSLLGKPLSVLSSLTRIPNFSTVHRPLTCDHTTLVFGPSDEGEMFEICNLALAQGMIHCMFRGRTKKTRVEIL